jgi:hypothetical protein
MSPDGIGFDALRALHADCCFLKEAGVPVVLLRGFAFRAGGHAVCMDLLLHPAQHSGYATRLFFESSLEGKGMSANWNRHRVVDREWWAPSWKDVPATLPWPAMVCAHLRAVA